MPPFAVEVHPLAADEAEAAERWYRERNETAALRFRRELDRAVELIAGRPEAALLMSATPDAFCCVDSLSLSSTGGVGRRVQVVAVAHARRRPHYWLQR